MKIIYDNALVICPYCSSLENKYYGWVYYGYYSTRRFICSGCNRTFTTMDNRMRFPSNLVYYCIDEFMGGESSRKIQKLVQDKFKIHISINMPSYWSAKFGEHNIVNKDKRFFLILSNLLSSKYNVISKKTFMELVMVKSPMTKNIKKIFDNNYVIRIIGLNGAYIINKGGILFDFPQLRDCFYEGVNQEDPTLLFRRKVISFYGKKRTLYKEIKKVFSIGGRPKGSLKYSLEELFFLKKCCGNKLKYNDIIRKWNKKFNRNLSLEARQLYNLMLRMGWIIPKKRVVSFYDGERICLRCNSDNSNRGGIVKIKSKLYQNFKCKDCGNRFHKKLLEND